MPELRTPGASTVWGKRSLVDQVTEVVRRSIVDGRLRPGATISISDLATDLGVSPTPVREALQRLALDGIMLLRPARTAVVAPLALDDLHEIYRLRRLVEVDAAVNACPQLTVDDHAALRSELEILAKQSLASEACWDSHNRFHRILLGQMSVRTERIVGELAIAGERYIRVAYAADADEQGRLLGERHAPLVDAVASGDPERIRVALINHLTSTESDLVARVSAILTDASRATPSAA